MHLEIFFRAGLGRLNAAVILRRLDDSTAVTGRKAQCESRRQRKGSQAADGFLPEIYFFFFELFHDLCVSFFVFGLWLGAEWGAKRAPGLG